MRSGARGRQLSSVASIVIVAFSTFDTGHPALALLAAVSNVAASAPGTDAFTTRCTAVIENPSPTFSNDTLADVRMLAGVRPIVPSCADSAIEKQPACAAAISSSGLVPLPSSNRVLNEYWVLARTPLSDEIVPLPSFKPPFHSADAL